MTEENDRLILLFGPMGSGKSTMLGRHISIRKRWTSVYAVNHISDIRYSDDGIATHDGTTFEAARVRMLKQLRSNEEYINSNTIVIDEGHFYEDIYEFIMEELKNTTKTFIIAGLLGDKNQEFIGDMYKLLPKADDIIFLRAICAGANDGRLASFTIALKETGSQKFVGGHDVYKSVSRKFIP